MTPLASTATTIFSWSTLVAQIVIVVSAIVLVAVILEHPNARLHRLSRKAGEHAILIGLIISLVSFMLSIFYSNVVGFQPCDLCWWQRIFLYPQVVLFAVAFYNEKVNKISDEMVFLYSFILSLLGGAIALFNYYGQMFNPEALAFCETQGSACSRIFFISFGYITIPMMSLTAYLVLIVLYFFRRHHLRKKSA
jgi:disulfide bond formation protein DsbB